MLNNNSSSSNNKYLNRLIPLPNKAAIIKKGILSKISFHDRQRQFKWEFLLTQNEYVSLLVSIAVYPKEIALHFVW